MPAVVVLHERHAFAFHRAENHGRRLAVAQRQIPQGFIDGLLVMAVHLPRRPAEYLKLLLQGFQVNDVTRLAKSLQAVVVHQHDEIVPMMLRRQHDGLPRGAFVQIAVAGHAENTVLPPRLLRRHRHAAGHRQPVPQRSRGEFHARNMVRNMAAQLAVVAVIFIKPFQREVAEFRQRGQQRRAAVPFAQNETVAVVLLDVFRIHVQDLRVEHGQDVRHGQHAADMPALPFVDHFQTMDPHFSRQFVAFGQFSFVHCFSPVVSRWYKTIQDIYFHLANKFTAFQ